MNMSTKKKKLIGITLLIIISCVCLFIFSNGNPTVEKSADEKIKDAIVLYINSQSAYVNGVLTEVDSESIDVKPISKNGRALVPIRFISEGFGADVSWDAKTKTATILIDGKVIEIQLDKTEMYVDGNLKQLEVPAESIGGRTFIPLRALCDVIGKKLFYDNNLIIISDIDKIFDPQKDEEEIEYVTSLVNILPRVETGEKLRELLSAEDQAHYIEYSATEKFDSRLSNISTTNVQLKGIDNADWVCNDDEYIYKVDLNKITIVKIKPIDDMKVVSTIDISEYGFKSVEMYVSGNRLVAVGAGLTNTTGLIYDISSRKVPKLSRTVEIDGEYLESRVIDETLYMISNKTKYLYETEGTLRYKDSAVSEEPNDIGYNNISYFPDSMSSNFLLIAGVDLTKKEPAKISTFLGAGDIIYVAEKNMYVAKVKYVDEKYSTVIYKFKLKKGNVNYLSNGVASGKLINRFAMDEYGDRLRVVTTKGDVVKTRDNTIKTNVFVFGRTMKKLGSLEGLAPGEEIYSTRFINNKLFLITLKTTDPVFIIDLSDEYRPVILGAMTLPGYNDYIYPFDETRIIGFGKDTMEVNVDSSVKRGFKVAVFDISDSNNPNRLFGDFIGGKGTDSEILYDYRALLFNKSENLLVLPIELKDKGDGVSFQGVYVYNVTLENGFVLEQEISHVDDKMSNDTKIRRTLRINDCLFTVSENKIKASGIKTKAIIGEVDI